MDEAKQASSSDLLNFDMCHLDLCLGNVPIDSIIPTVNTSNIDFPMLSTEDILGFSDTQGNLHPTEMLPLSFDPILENFDFNLDVDNIDKAVVNNHNSEADYLPDEKDEHDDKYDKTFKSDSSDDEEKAEKFVRRQSVRIQDRTRRTIAQRIQQENQRLEREALRMSSKSKEICITDTNKDTSALDSERIVTRSSSSAFTVRQVSVLNKDEDDYPLSEVDASNSEERVKSVYKEDDSTLDDEESIEKSDDGDESSHVSHREDSISSEKALDSVMDYLTEFPTLQEEDDPTKLWCICRRPHEYRFMICCDACDEWFHGDCVGISELDGQQMESCGEEFRCPNCSQQSSLNTTTVLQDISIVAVEDTKHITIAHDVSNADTLTPSTELPTCELNNEKVSEFKSSELQKDDIVVDIIEENDQRKRDQNATTLQDASNVPPDLQTVSSCNLEISVPTILLVDCKKTLSTISPDKSVVYQKQSVSPEDRPNQVKRDSSSKVIKHPKHRLRTKKAVLPPSQRTPAVSTPSLNASSTAKQPLNQSQQHESSCLGPRCAKRVDARVQLYCSSDCMGRYVQETIDLNRAEKQNHFGWHRGGELSRLQQFVMLERRSGNVLSGKKAPREDNLLRFLEVYPTYEVIRNIAALEEKSEASSNDKINSEPRPQVPKKESHPVRSRVRKVFAEVLEKRVKLAGDIFLTRRDFLRIIVTMEEALYRHYDNEVTLAYQARARLLMTHLKDIRNEGLYRRLLSGDITPRKLVGFTSEQMSSPHMMRPPDTKTTVTMATVGSAPSATADTTSQHGKHLYDVNCDICTGRKRKMAAPSEETTSTVPADVKEVTAASPLVTNGEGEGKDEKPPSSKRPRCHSGKDGHSASSLPSSHHRNSSGSHHHNNHHHHSNNKHHQSSNHHSRHSHNNSSSSTSHRHSSSHHQHHKSSSSSSSKDRGDRDKERLNRSDRGRHSNRSEKDKRHSNTGGTSSTLSGSCSPKETPAMSITSINTTTTSSTTGTIKQEPTVEQNNTNDIDNCVSSTVLTPELLTAASLSDDHHQSVTSSRAAAGDINNTDIQSQGHRSMEKVGRLKGSKKESTEPTSSHTNSSSSSKPSVVSARTGCASSTASATTTSSSQHRRKLECVWRGQLNLRETGKVNCKAFAVSSSLDTVPVSNHVTPLIPLVGRTDIQMVTKYLKSLRDKSKKEVTIIRFHPTTEEDRPAYLTLFNYFHSRSRCGVGSRRPAHVKDFFLFPLNAHSHVPKVFLPFTGPGLEDRRPHLLLGVIVWDVQLVAPSLLSEFSSMDKQSQETASSQEVSVKGATSPAPFINHSPSHTDDSAALSAPIVVKVEPMVATQEIMGTPILKEALPTSISPPNDGPVLSEHSCNQEAPSIITEDPAVITDTDRVFEGAVSFMATKYIGNMKSEAIVINHQDNGFRTVTTSEGSDCVKQMDSYNVVEDVAIKNLVGNVKEDNVLRPNCKLEPVKEVNLSPPSNELPNVPSLENDANTSVPPMPPPWLMLMSEDAKRSTLLPHSQSPLQSECPPLAMDDQQKSSNSSNNISNISNNLYTINQHGEFSSRHISSSNRNISPLVSPRKYLDPRDLLQPGAGLPSNSGDIHADTQYKRGESSTSSSSYRSNRYIDTRDYHSHSTDSFNNGSHPYSRRGTAERQQHSNKYCTSSSGEQYSDHRKRVSSSFNTYDNTASNDGRKYARYLESHEVMADSVVTTNHQPEVYSNERLNSGIQSAGGDLPLPLITQLSALSRDEEIKEDRLKREDIPPPAITSTPDKGERWRSVKRVGINPRPSVIGEKEIEGTEEEEEDSYNPEDWTPVEYCRPDCGMGEDLPPEDLMFAPIWHGKPVSRSSLFPSSSCVPPPASYHH